MSLPRLPRICRLPLPAALLLALLLAPRLPAPAGAAEGGLLLAASIPPLATLVSRVAPEAEVFSLVPAGAEAHTYEPRPADLARLARSAALFRAGLEFEEALSARLSAANPGLPVARLDAGVATLPYPARAHDCGSGCAHPAGAPDPHVWLAPRRMARMAETVASTLAAADPSRAERYRANASALSAECELLHAELAALLAPARGRAFLSFHASWGYFAEAFGLRQIPVESGGREPGPADLARIIATARTEGVRVMLVQPQFGSRAPERIAEATGCLLVPADDLAADWAGSLRAAAAAFAAAHRRSPAPPPPARK